MDEKSATRERILNAAVARIKHYGYGKTTMAEIAADCSMSPGNIYRFFEAKIDIAEAMARRHEADIHARMAALARRADQPVDKRLRDIVHAQMRDNYNLVEQHNKMLEVAEVLARERPLFFNECMAQERVILGALLQEGVDQGLFTIADVNFTAEMLQSATAKFGFPKLFCQLTLPKLERELDGVLDLIFNGLYSREPHEMARALTALPSAPAKTG